MQKQEYNFIPKINNYSNDIAKKVRQKLESTCETKVNKIEWLSQSGKNAKWKEVAKEIIDQETMKECTFKPKTNSCIKSARGKS